MSRRILEWFMVHSWQEFGRLMLPSLVTLVVLWSGIYALMILAGA